MSDWIKARIGSPSDQGGPATRTRRRSPAVLAVAVAVGMLLIAFPASSAAAPPVVPTCTLPNTTGSDSCATLRVNAATPPMGGVFEPMVLGFRIRSQFDPPTSETTNIELRFKDNIAIDLSGIPSCPSSELVGKNIGAAWEQCGPGADGSPASEGNAYLSTAGPGDDVSGIVSNIPLDGGGIGCLMLFKGADNLHMTIYWRWPVQSAETSCNNPATNNAGSASLLFTGTLTQLPETSAYGWVLEVPNFHTSNPPVDDLYGTLGRSDHFQARCPAGTSPFLMRAEWDYTVGGDLNDVRGATDPCP